MPNIIQVTEAPMMVERVHGLITKKDTKYPDNPACNGGNGTQEPVMGCHDLELSCSVKQCKQMNAAKAAPQQVELNSLDHNICSIEI